MSDFLTKPLVSVDYYKFLSGAFFERYSLGNHTSGGVVEWDGLFNS